MAVVPLRGGAVMDERATAAARPPARVGVFGGAFDPPHAAHVALAEAAIEELALDRLHVLPTGDAWHKSRPLSPAADRLAMCRLAFAGVARAFVDDRELRRAGPTYTIDTLRELASEYPGAALFLQIGEDQAGAFHTWRQAVEIAAMATISIAVRAAAARAGGRFESEAKGLAAPVPPMLPGVAGSRVRILKLAAMPHSATEIRRRAAAGEPLGDWIDPAVARYIADHHLYTPVR